MKTNLDKSYKTDKNLEKEGIWFDVSETAGFKIKRFGGMNSPSVKAASAKFYQPYAKLVSNGSLPMEKEREIMIKTFVASSIVDWKGIEVDGKETPFSFDACVAVLIELPELADSLVEYASAFKHYREDLGNS
jgi:hypothetical protein